MYRTAALLLALLALALWAPVAQGWLVPAPAAARATRTALYMGAGVS